MFSELIKQIPGITIYPIVVTIAFFLTFTGIIIWAIRANKKYVKHMSELPLDKEEYEGDDNERK